ncbi:MAG: phytanoyl-CoA dioxygenase [Rhodopseudomonas sp.]|nr:phytanoyl-CoA dioxygenase [Rhodopseudomonas sp.]
MIAARHGARQPFDLVERQRNFLLIYAIGLGLEQAARYFNRDDPDLGDFETWIVATTGGIAPDRVARLNAALTGAPPPEAAARQIAAIEAAPPVLSADDLAFWHEHGYVVLHDAVPRDSLAAAARAVWDYAGASPDDPGTWHRPNDHGIMVQQFQHPAFEANRRSPRLHKAFAQLWGHADLWTTTDRVGFNPPVTPDAPYRGHALHWDVSLKTPIPFGTQGVLYLEDTAPEQGAFTAVPGFQRWGEDWLRSLPPGANPRDADLHALGATPIGGRAGDLIIWHHALPHGASPNTAGRPRLVQYINMFPAYPPEQAEWI